MDYEKKCLQNVVTTECKQIRKFIAIFVIVDFIIMVILNSYTSSLLDSLIITFYFGSISISLLVYMWNNYMDRFGNLEWSVVFNNYEVVIGQYKYSTKDYAYFIVNNSLCQVYFLPEDLNDIRENLSQDLEFPLYSVATGCNDKSRIYGCLEYWRE